MDKQLIDEENDDDLEAAIQLSLKENEYKLQDDKKNDELEREYEKVLKLSLIEK